MTALTEYQQDALSAQFPFVVVRAHRSRICGWIPSWVSHHKTRSEASKAAKALHESAKVYVRVEKWKKADGHAATVLDEFGVNPGIDETTPRWNSGQAVGAES